MLADLNEVFQIANEKKIAIGAFNVVNFEHIQAILEAAEKLNMPTILAFAQTHEENDIAYLEEMGPVMVLMAKRAKVPVVVHLDHGVDLDYIEKALKLGFTSMMFDGSSLPYEENVKMTQKAVALAKKYGVTIEAEI
ncbi:class II fructose-bisphosphate aldolase, partial [Absicoccus porci]